MPNKTFETYFDERIAASGPAPPEGDQYLVLRSGVVYKTSFGQIAGFAAWQDDTGVTTTIANVNEWTAPANTLVQYAVSPALAFAANAFTYAGLSQTSPTRIFANVSLIKPQATEMAYQIGIAINGSVVTPHNGVGVTDTQMSFVQTEYYYALQAGDVVSFMIRNISGDHDITLIDGQLGIG